MDNTNYTTEHRKGQHLLSEERHEIDEFSERLGSADRKILIKRAKIPNVKKTGGISTVNW